MCNIYFKATIYSTKSYRRLLGIALYISYLPRSTGVTQQSMHRGVIDTQRDAAYVLGNHNSTPTNQYLYVYIQLNINDRIYTMI